MNGQITICIFQAKMLTPMSSRRCLQTWPCLQFAFGWKQMTLKRGLRSVTQSIQTSTNWHYLRTSWPSMERMGNRKIMLPRENIHCYCFFVQQMSFFAEKEVLNLWFYLGKPAGKITLAPNGLHLRDCSDMFPMVTWENSAKVRMLRIRSRIYDL